MLAQIALWVGIIGTPLGIALALIIPCIQGKRLKKQIEQDIKESRKIDPDIPAYTNGVPSSVVAKEFQEGLKDLKRALEEARYPIKNGSIDYDELGRSRIKEQRWDDAIEVFNRALRRAKKDSEKAVLNNFIGYTYNEKQNWEQARGAYANGLRLAELAGDTEARMDALNGLGQALMYLGDYNNATAKLDEGFKLAREVENEEYCGTFLGNLGNVYFRKDDYTNAKKAYIEALEIHQQLGNKLGVALDLGNLGMIYSRLDDFVFAEKNVKASLELFRSLGDQSGEASQLGNLGLIYKYFDNYAAAEKTHKKSLEIDRRLGNMLGEAQTLGNLGFLAEDLGQYQTAYPHLKLSLAIFEGIGATPDDADKVRDSLENCVEELKARGVDPDSLPPLDLDNLPQIVPDDGSAPSTSPEPGGTQ